MTLRRFPPQALVGALIVVLFAGFCVQLLVDVTRLRGGLERRVTAGIELQAMDRALGELLEPGTDSAPALAAIGTAMSKVSSAVAALDDDALRAQAAALSVATGKVVTADPGSLRAASAVADQARIQLVSSLGRQNGQISGELGAQWNRLGAVVFASLALAVAMLAFMVMADRRRQRAEELRLEVEAAYREVRFARDAAERSDRAKSRLLANVSHEFRTPMNGVIGMADLLRGTALDSEQREFLDVIAASGTLLMTLVEQLLDFSMLEGGGIDLKEEEFDLLLATEEALVLVAPRAVEANLELSLHWAPEVPRGVIGDGPRLRQIILNLLSNAAKFTTTGRIEVRVASARSDFGTAVVRFEIEDTGIGLPVGEHESMFEPFVQGDSSRANEGSGLGLAIVRRLVEAMDGKVDVDSEQGVGSTFWFSLPLRLGSDPDRRGPRLKRLLGKRILVLEADPVNRAIWEEELSRHGAVVRCFNTLAPLAEAVGESTWMVTMAVRRGESGAESLAGLREVWPDGPVVFTAPMGWSEASVGEDKDVLGVIHRPLRVSSLARRVLRLMLGPVLSVAGDESSIVGMDLGPAPEPGARRILVVDDHEGNRRTVSAVLLRAGYDVRLATNGFEAVDLTLAGDLDMVLMDCRMPDMDGLEATSLIRDAEAGERHTPIVAMTGDAVPGDRARFREAGMDGLLIKPISPETLREVVKKWTS